MNGNRLLTAAQIVDLLNSQFGLRSDNRLANARTHFQQAVVYSVNAMTEVLAGSSGGVLNLSSANRPLYQDFRDAAQSVNEAFGGTRAIAGILPLVEVNLDTFFANPANGDTIEIDPFVAEGGKIRAVEAYWNQMMGTACNYTIGRGGISAFSEASKAVSRPYYQLFNAIMGHTFGKHRAGRGA